MNKSTQRKIKFWGVYIFFILYSLFVIKAIFFPDWLFTYPINSYNKLKYIPFYTILISGFLSILLYFFYSIFLFFKEKRITGISFIQSPSHYWFFVNIFSRRYRSIKTISFAFALFTTSIIYFFGISLTLYFIHSSEIVFVTENNDMTFFFNEGIIVTSIVIIFTFWIFANTSITSNKQIPFESLDDLIYYLSGTEDGTPKSVWERYNNNVFYYVFDYSISIGHISDKDNFKKYLIFLYNLLHNYPVKFQAITYKKEKLIEKFEKLYNITTISEQQSLCIEANDEAIYYLNNFKEKKAGQKRDKNVFKHIFYSCFRTKEKEFYNTFIKNEMEDFVKGKKLCTPELDEYNKVPDDKTNLSFIHYTIEIGLTRFIVSNLFVIQFVASNNKNGKVPAGYISEDITLIERYKNAFEEYMKSENS